VPRGRARGAALTWRGRELSRETRARVTRQWTDFPLKIENETDLGWISFWKHEKVTWSSNEREWWLSK
jgi:hypothetical protein